MAVSPSIRALAGAALLSLALPAAASAGARVHLRGTAYEFNNTRVVLSGATIRVAEFPKLTATVRPDGTYDLAVPDHARVTPYITAAGYHTIYLQTFATAGENLKNVNFQTPTDAVYGALAALMHVPVDAAGNPKQCAIVSTFSTRNVRDLDYPSFIAYGAHGVAGATATATPKLPRPTYFNAQVIPDPAQQLSSDDGGVLCGSACRPASTPSAPTSMGRASRASSRPAAPGASSTPTRRGGCTSWGCATPRSCAPQHAGSACRTCRRARPSAWRGAWSGRTAAPWTSSGRPAGASR